MSDRTGDARMAVVLECAACPYVSMASAREAHCDHDDAKGMVVSAWAAQHRIHPRCPLPRANREDVHAK